MRRVLAITGLGALALLGLATGFASNGLASKSGGADSEPHKVFVCKYVGKPGVDERLQTGNNPIDVAASSIPGYEKGTDLNGLIGFSFADAQGRSYVLAVDTGQPEPDVSQCPTGNNPVDLCPNIDGVQTTVPDGLVVDEQGNCVAEPTETTPTETTPTETTPTEMTPTETTPTETTATEMTPTETTPTETTATETTPPAAETAPTTATPTMPTTARTAPLAPPTTTAKPAVKKAVAAKPAVKKAPTTPKQAVAGAYAQGKPALAHTP